jgi:endonuclease/exonuclease/phosphatase family metal-dependent hydrolase
MLNRNLILLWTLLLSASTLQAQSDSSRIVRVLSFNILHGATTKGDFDLDAIAKVIKDADPDLVALQEVDFQTKRAKGYDLATELG